MRTVKPSGQITPKIKQVSNSYWLIAVPFTAYLMDVFHWQEHRHVCACRDPASGDAVAGC